MYFLTKGIMSSEANVRHSNFILSNKSCFRNLNVITVILKKDIPSQGFEPMTTVCTALSTTYKAYFNIKRTTGVKLEFELFSVDILL